MCSYFGALGKLMQGTGFEEIVIESGICASGSMYKVMSGKHYNRALRVHVLMLEALERCLFKQFEQHTNSNILIKSVKKNISESMLFIDEDSLECASENEDFKYLWMRCSHFREGVHQGRLGKTAQFWIKYMDKVWLLLKFLRATRNNFIVHVQCLQELCLLFFAMDHQDYARYVSAYLMSLTNLSHSHPCADELLKNWGFSVSRSHVPASRTAVDMSIEQTINRQAKSKWGIIGFSRNMPAYYRWCLTRHTRAEYLNATLEQANMIKEDTSIHKEERPSKIRESEAAVQRVHSAVNRFINPSDIDEKESLICLSSEMRAAQTISDDLLSVDHKGQQQFNEFVQKRLVEKEHPFHNPIKKTSPKTFHNDHKTVTVKSSKQQSVQIAAQRNIFGQLLMLTTNYDLDLQKCLLILYVQSHGPLQQQMDFQQKQTKVH